jgi:cytochrome c peroxidase
VAWRGPENDADERRIALGRKLFFDSAPSVDGKISCASCHQPELFGTDRLARSQGVLGRSHVRNSPTVFNSARQFVQHWRGDRASVEEQAVRSLVGPASTGNASLEEAIGRLARAGYEKQFRAVFPGQSAPLNETNFGAAVGAFVRTLSTPAPFDRFLEGDDAALNKDAQRGLSVFLSIGCANCHEGAGVGGERYAPFGAREPYWNATGSAEHDPGRFDVTKVEGDRYVFKVPTLRNVAETYPYFHDGSVRTLRDAILVMARVQLGIRLAPAQAADLEAFLRSLTGDRPANFAPPKD